MEHGAREEDSAAEREVPPRCEESEEVADRTAAKPSPVPRGAADPASAPPRRPGARALIAPAAVAVALVVVALVTNGALAAEPRFGGVLHGGRLLPVGDLATTWRDYLSAWHPVDGGTGAPASPALLVLALLGSVLGGPSVVVAALLLFDMPLAGLTAYAATRRLPVARRWRAVGAVAYGLLPVAASSAAQGRLDVVVAHVLVPPVLAGIASVLGLTEPKTGQWLGSACLTSLGAAVLGAFSPLLHLAVLVLALIGYVATPGAAERRRAAGVAAVVLLSVACLLPWPTVLFRDPAILLRGPGAQVAEPPAGPWLLALSPDGTPAGWSGAVVVLAAVTALVLAPSRRMVPGVVVAAVGWALAAVVGSASTTPIGGGAPTPGWAGAPLVLAAAGCVWVVLSAGAPRVPVRALVPVLVTGLVLLASGAAWAGAVGPLRAGGGAALPGTVLVLPTGTAPARLLEPGHPRFGDDDLVPVPTAVDWLNGVRADLRSGDAGRVRSAIASAAARGAEFVATPDAARIRDLAGGLVTDRGGLADGTPLLHLELPSSPVKLLGPDLARHARTEAAPAPEARPLPVEGRPPHVAFRVSEGGLGRTLLLGAENEPGWRAVVDGREFPLATAWGHQVAVPLPARAAEVEVDYTEVPRTALLILQAAAILFTAVAALPELRRRRKRTRAG
ncbi:hypothetical protein [Saccharopolyspora rosea]|uniref:hypothetical protein n=1 Tax=Saccharopolyspora rosea TaxID=524884 RepID=UPI0021DB0140|nr:hypothetical protein [Saccharopolyspora rosea]